MLNNGCQSMPYGLWDFSRTTGKLLPPPTGRLLPNKFFHGLGLGFGLALGWGGIQLPEGVWYTSLRIKTEKTIVRNCTSKQISSLFYRGKEFELMRYIMHFYFLKFPEFYKNMKKNITHIKDVICKDRTSHSQVFYNIAMPKKFPKLRETSCHGDLFQ